MVNQAKEMADGAVSELKRFEDKARQAGSNLFVVVYITSSSNFLVFSYL